MKRVSFELEDNIYDTFSRVVNGNVDITVKVWIESFVIGMAVTPELLFKAGEAMLDAPFVRSAVSKIKKMTK